MTVVTYPGMRPGNRQGWCKRSKIHVRWAAAPWTRPSAPGCGDTLKASASYGSIHGGDQGILAPGSLSTGSPAGRTPLLLKRGGGSMYSQAHVRAGCP